MAQINQTNQHEENLAPHNVNKWSILKQYSIDDPWVAPAIQLNWTRHTAWGFQLAHHMLDWMQQLKWPKTESQDEIMTIGVSWYELVLSFMKHAGFFLPLRRTDNQGREILLPFRNRQEVVACGAKFSEFANTFAIFYLQFTGLLSDAIWPGYDRKLVKSLFVQGSQIYTSGFAMRPVFPFQDWVFEILQPFLRDHQGQSFTDLPELEPVITDDFYKVLQSDLKGTWKSRSMATRRQMKLMRQWRSNPPQLIHFGSQS